MASTMATRISPPDTTQLLAPFLPALPAATISSQPAIGILPLLSPILRQRVKILSIATTEPWLQLLCYDAAKVPKLLETVKSGNLEPHPVSGEVEVDWDYDAEIQYRRVDQETFQALVSLANLGLAFQLVYCVGDAEGGGDGWRVGEVTLAEKPSPFEGVSNIAEAERQFQESRAKKAATQTHSNTLHAPNDVHHHNEEEEDDDDYWARYDATPARTPSVKRSPAPRSMPATSQAGDYRASSAEDAYYAQYDSVQPAMDNHDPDEEAAQADIVPPLGLGRVVSKDSGEASENNETQGAWTLAEREDSTSNREDDEEQHTLVHPRPSSSASSNGSNTVAKLEATADKQGQNEFGVKQHVSRSIRSLFLLARSSGIDRDEFERMVHTELDVLGMIEDHD